MASCGLSVSWMWQKSPYRSRGLLVQSFGPISELEGALVVGERGVLSIPGRPRQFFWGP